MIGGPPPTEPRCDPAAIGQRLMALMEETYNVRVLRQAVKDIASLPEERASLIAWYIDRLQENPRPPDAKRLQQHR